MPGSMIILFLFIPFLTAKAILSLKNAVISFTTSLYAGLLCISLGVPFMCIIITGQPASAAIFAIIGSNLRPLISLIIEAPAFNASFATFALYVSIEINISILSESFFITGITLSNSTSKGTGSAPGLEDSPPISIMSAPSSAILLAHSTELFIVK